MLQPSRTKYRKQQKGRNTGIATRGNKVSFGEFGLKATTRGRLTARQLEAARRALSRHIKRGGRVWIRVFPDVPAGSDQVIGFCESVMQRVKASGKNKVMVRTYDPDEIDSIRRMPLRVVR